MYRPVCSCPRNKPGYNVTYTQRKRFRAKHISDSEQITACAVVLNYTLDPHLRGLRCCTVLHRNFKLLNFDIEPLLCKNIKISVYFFSCELFPFYCQLV